MNIGNIEHLEKVTTLAETFSILRDPPSSMHDHMEFIRDTASRATRVLELGVNQGTSCVALMHGLQPGGEMVSVDLQGPLTPIRFILEWCAGEVRERNWMFMEADTMDAMKRLRAWGWRPDLVFIDSSHQYDLTVKEIAFIEPWLAPGGKILMHDTVSFPEVNQAFREFTERTGWEHHNREVCHGLGVIRKP